MIAKDFAKLLLTTERRLPLYIRFDESLDNYNQECYSIHGDLIVKNKAIKRQEDKIEDARLHNIVHMRHDYDIDFMNDVLTELKKS